MRQFEFTQKLSLLANSGIDDDMNYSRHRRNRKKNVLTKSSLDKNEFDDKNVQLKLF